LPCYFLKKIQVHSVVLPWYIGSRRACSLQQAAHRRKHNGALCALVLARHSLGIDNSPFVKVLARKY
jgi:hypothetical protein